MRRRLILPSSKSCLSHLIVAALAFYAGVTVGNFASSNNNNCYYGVHRSNLNATQQGGSIDESFKIPDPLTNNKEDYLSWPSSIYSIVAGAARVPRDDFMQAFDLGVPLDPTTEQNKEVLLLYGSKSIPSHLSGDNSGIPQITSAEEATKKCNIVKQILLQPNRPNDCLALVGQWESYHVHKWLRVGNDQKGKLDVNAPFQNVARSHSATKGQEEAFPRHGQSVLMATQYGKYISLLDELYAELKPVAKEVADRGVYKNTVIAMVCNKGQSILLANFVCSAKARGLDTSKVLLFASDLHTLTLAKSLGLTAYHNEKLFADMPEKAADVYGDQTFKAMMMGKIYVVQLLNLLGHDVLFTDVDVIWFKDPLDYFLEKVPANFDIYFQDDGQHSYKYAPYSGNSGFYYIRQNKRTRFMLSHLARMGDVVMNTGSHQAAMTTVMTEHSSWRGLKVKTISRDEPDLPCGYHYIERRQFMNEMLTGKVEPYIFHMSWTDNKDTKIKRFQQIGEWYWNNGDKSSCDKESALDCCLKEPIFQCHFRGSPSKKPC